MGASNQWSPDVHRARCGFLRILRRGAYRLIGRGEWCPWGLAAVLGSNRTTPDLHRRASSTQREAARMSERNAAVSLSGGLVPRRSSRLLRAEGFMVHALSSQVRSASRNRVGCRREIAGRAGVRQHVEVEIDLRPFGGFALTAVIDVLKTREISEMSDGIPVTYVPARNNLPLLCRGLGGGARMWATFGRA